MPNKPYGQRPPMTEAVRRDRCEQELFAVLRRYRPALARAGVYPVITRFLFEVEDVADADTTRTSVSDLVPINGYDARSIETRVVRAMQRR